MGSSLRKGVLLFLNAKIYFLSAKYTGSETYLGPGHSSSLGICCTLAELTKVNCCSQRLIMTHVGP